MGLHMKTKNYSVFHFGLLPAKNNEALFWALFADFRDFRGNRNFRTSTNSYSS